MTRRITQEEAARIFDVSFPTYSRWENGHYRPTRQNLEKIQQFIRGRL